MNLLIKNARIIDENSDYYGEVLLLGGKIQGIAKEIPGTYKELDLEGKILMPAFIDLHAHFRYPGLEEKEDLETGSKAALKGGYGLVNLMANTKPVVSSMDLVDKVLNKSRDLGLTEVHQSVSLTRDLEGKDLSHLDSLGPEVLFLSDDGRGLVSNELMYKALVKSREINKLIMVHSEDPGLTKIDYRISEDLITLRDIYLAEVTGASLHFCHVSTRRSIDLIRGARARGLNISCEVTPHHIYDYGLDYRVHPPFREKQDQEALIQAIKDGVVDAIATDHAPHTPEDKLKGAPGISGLETSFSISYTSLVESGHIGLMDLSRLMSSGPARIFKRETGLIRPGYPADLVVVDPDYTYKLSTSNFLSKGKNTPFEGRELKGRVLCTIKSGKVLYDYRKGIL